MANRHILNKTVSALALVPLIFLGNPLKASNYCDDFCALAQCEQNSTKCSGLFTIDAELLVWTASLGRLSVGKTFGLTRAVNISNTPFNGGGGGNYAAPVASLKQQINEPINKATLGAFELAGAFEGHEVLLKPHWSAGWGASISYKLPSSNTVIFANGQYFQTSAQEALATLGTGQFSGGGFGGTPNFIYTSGSFFLPYSSGQLAQYYDDVRALKSGIANATIESNVASKYAIDFSSASLNLGYTLQIYSRLDFTPFFGARGIFTRQTQKSFFSTSLKSDEILDDSTIELSQVYSSDQKFEIYSAGVQAGARAEYFLGAGFSLTGEADVALLWTQAKSKTQYGQKLNLPNIGIDDNGQQVFTFLSELDYSGSGQYCSRSDQIRPAFDLNISLKWTDTFMQNRLAGALIVGWESHLFLDYYTPRDETYSIFNQDNIRPYQNWSKHDLALYGLTVKLQLSF